MVWEDPAVCLDRGEDQRPGPAAAAIIFVHDHPGLEGQQPDTEQPGQHERPDYQVAPGWIQTTEVHPERAACPFR